MGRFPSGQDEPTNFSREILGALGASEDGGGEIGGRAGWAGLADRTSEWWLGLMARSLSQAPNPTTQKMTFSQRLLAALNLEVNTTICRCG